MNWFKTVFTGGVVCALLAALAVVAPTSASADDSGTIIVSANGFKDDSGQAIVAVYKKGEGWLDLKKSFRKETATIKNGRVTVKLADVPHGEYGITVLHDRNKNGKMDMRWLPFPKPLEGGGVSNNYVRTGKPDYDKAKFVLERSFMSVRIKLVYQ